MRAITTLFTAILLMPVLAVAAPVQVAGVQIDNSAGRTELVLSLTAPTDHTLFTLSHPDRIVIDLTNAQLASALPAGRGVVSDLRSGMHDKNLRLVLDLAGRVTPRSFLRGGNANPQLVVDLFTPGGTLTPSASVSTAAAVANTASDPAKGRDIVVAIDAGHGGKDPGARGPYGAQEKNVTLAIARKLKALIDRQPGMKAVLTRDGDYYVDLTERFQRARAANADIFISIHCDASRDRSADGATVYVLSEHGATTEHARWLEKEENDADLLGGVALSNQSPIVRSVLVDMSQSAVMSMSFDAGASVAQQLAAIGAMHRNSVQQAAFVVLKAPDVPSMLVETNYITNPRTAKLLLSSHYQDDLAKAIFNGVDDYFDRYPPPGTQLAMLKLQKSRPSGASATAGYVVASNPHR